MGGSTKDSFSSSDSNDGALMPPVLTGEPRFGRNSSLKCAVLDDGNKYMCGVLRFEFNREVHFNSFD